MTDQQQAASVKRYNLQCNWPDAPCMAESDTGHYVKASDYAAAITERDVAREDCDELQKWKANVETVHKLMDEHGVPAAAGVSCNDPKCQTHLYHRVHEILAERDAADDRAVRAQQLAKLLSDEAVIALSGAQIPTPATGYIRAYPDGAGPGQLGADIRRLAAERDAALAELADSIEVEEEARIELDAARRECERLVSMTDQSELTKLREDYDANLTELTKLREQVAHQTATISAMAETCARDKNEIERLKQILHKETGLINATCEQALGRELGGTASSKVTLLAKQLDEAVALLRRCVLVIPCGWDGTSADVYRFLAHYDAERAEGKGEG